MAFKESIIKTLSYFDLFQYPLTKEELYRFLWNTDSTDFNLGYTDFVKELNCLDIVENKHGFYFLPGKEDAIAKRQERVQIVENKMQIAKRGIKKLRWIPFLRSVFICNTVAFGMALEDSDIDVFVIARKGHVWFVRFWATLILKFWGLRTSKRKTKNKICLSFFTSDSCLNLESLSICEPDIYMIYWLSNLVPVYDPGNLLQSIYKANSWVLRYTPYAFLPYTLFENWNVADSTYSKWVKKIGERIFFSKEGRIEQCSKQLQLPRINAYYGLMMKKQGTEVVVTDTVLKFHENDRRKEYYIRWKDVYDKYLVEEKLNVKKY